ncbi:hypothetical protein QTL86_14435 [Cellulosilyticum sp. ST5]|uniref:hypothetical protein n=1 Tax=unclassified Cellulosilyticum TaxID=2643091 RepID=UPI000F8E19BC|nr:hypothetical protein [Cellulosilyticum sp. WCF-2]QEH68041.1 hypothetical protein EKH84_06415 [Cellulosilyticum sp. WCF-2]
MEENKKAIQTLTDEELMDLVGGVSFPNIINIIKFPPLFPPLLPPVKVIPPIMALYAISPIITKF